MSPGKVGVGDSPWSLARRGFGPFSIPQCGTRRRLLLGDIVTAAMLAWTMGSLLGVGLVVVGVLAAYAIYYLVFRLGK